MGKQYILKGKELIEGVKPQKMWFRSHPTLFYNLLALGIGSLITFVIVMVPLPIEPKQTQENEAIDKFFLYIKSHIVLKNLFIWFLRWLVGIVFGAGYLKDWVLSAWPSIEFDFGADHLKEEKHKRQRILAATTIIIIPIIINIISDIIQQISFSN